MGGGLLQLVAYGAQDVYLTGNPQITFFKAVYRRHTNFAMEAIEQTFNGNADFGSRVTCQISRNGDLIHRAYLQVKLSGTDNYCKYFGFRVINYVEIEIGGQRIDKHYAHWLYVWNELSLPVGKRDGFNDMIGAYGGSATNGDINRTLYVPLEFWFCRNVGLALPLIALQYHEVKINIEFETRDNMVDTSQNYSDKAFQLVGKDYVAISGSKKNSELGGSASNLAVSEISLWVDYIFLDTDERRRFAQLTHEYLIEQLQFTGSDTITASATNMKSIRMNFNHPCKELIWYVKPDKTGSGSVNLYWTNFSSRTIDNNVYLGKNPVVKAKIQLNGNDRFAEREGDYFSLVQPYQHHENTPDVFHKGINVYSFAIKPEEHQPSGTLNMSRIDTAILSVSSEVAGSVYIYTMNYNVLRILSGMGGLAYSN